MLICSEQSDPNILVVWMSTVFTEMFLRTQQSNIGIDERMYRDCTENVLTLNQLIFYNTGA